MKTKINSEIRLTAKNLKMLPVGKFEITANPYITSPDFVERKTLHIYESDGEKLYGVSDGNQSIMLIIIESEKGEFQIEGVSNICGFGVSAYTPACFYRFRIEPRGSFREMINKEAHLFTPAL